MANQRKGKAAQHEPALAVNCQTVGAAQHSMVHLPAWHSKPFVTLPILSDNVTAWWRTCPTICQTQGPEPTCVPRGKPLCSRQKCTRHDQHTCKRFCTAAHSTHSQWRPHGAEPAGKQQHAPRRCQCASTSAAQNAAWRSSAAVQALWRSAGSGSSSKRRLARQHCRAAAVAQRRQRLEHLAAAVRHPVAALGVKPLCRLHAEQLYALQDLAGPAHPAALAAAAARNDTLSPVDCARWHPWCRRLKKHTC